MSQSAWATSLDAAREYALRTVMTVGNARGWTDQQIAWAVGVVEMYAEEADGVFWDDDVPEFWASLARHFADVVADRAVTLDNGATTSPPPALEKLVHAFATAAVSAGGAEEFARASSPVGLVADTAAASAADVSNAAVDVATTTREVIVTAGDAARTLRNKKVLGGVVAGCVLLGLGAWAVSR